MTDHDIGTPGEPARPPMPPSPVAAAPAAVMDDRALGRLESLLKQIGGDLVRERRSRRRWNLVMRLAWFGLVVAIVWLLASDRSNVTAPVGPHTELIEVRGEIGVGAEASSDNLMPALRTAFEDKGAKAIVLRINSPGGSPVQSGIINDEIRRLKQLHDKKVYAVVEEMCASGAYYIAVAADDIYVDKASLVGSIGVLMDGFGFVGLMDKLGIERRLLTAGENKGMLDPFSPQNATQTAYAQAMIDQVHQQFIDVVKAGRGDRLKITDQTFSGLFWNGEQAVQMGLADGFGSLDQVARDVVGADNVIDYTPQENVAERLAKRFGAAIGDGAMRALRSIGPLQ